MVAVQRVSTTAYSAYLTLSPYSGVLLSLFGYHKGAATRWLQLHEFKTSAPSPGAVPFHSFAIGAADNFSMIIPVTGIPFSNGLIAMISSTADTLTIGSSDLFMCATLVAN